MVSIWWGTLVVTGLKCQEHKEKGQKFAYRANIKIYFNNKRNLSTDSVVKDKVKTLKKDREKQL